VRTRFRPFGALTVIVSGSLLLGLGVASPAVAVEDYPSWDEVEQARQDEAAAAAAMRDIQELLINLEIQSADLARQAQAQAATRSTPRPRAPTSSTSRRPTPSTGQRPRRDGRGSSSPGSPAPAAAT
jgi:hypothetical protein